MTRAANAGEPGASSQSDVHWLKLENDVNDSASRSRDPGLPRQSIVPQSPVRCSWRSGFRPSASILRGSAFVALIPGVIALARQFGVYLMNGGVAAVANFLSGELIRAFSESAVVYGASVVIGMAIGTVISFFLHRRFTFAVADEPAAPQALRFSLVTVGGLVIAFVFAEAVLWLWELAGAPWLSRASVQASAHVAAIGLNAVYGFVAMKLFALKRRSPESIAVSSPLSEEPSAP